MTNKKGEPVDFKSTANFESYLVVKDGEAKAVMDTIGCPLKGYIEERYVDASKDDLRYYYYVLRIKCQKKIRWMFFKNYIYNGIYKHNPMIQ